jgi:hypothetical protein
MLRRERCRITEGQYICSVCRGDHVALVLACAEGVDDTLNRVNKPLLAICIGERFNGGVRPPPALIKLEPETAHLVHELLNVLAVPGRAAFEERFEMQLKSSRVRI